MTNAIRKSLEENMEFILENTPKEFHEQAKATAAAAEPIAILSEDEAKKEALAIANDNPQVDNETLETAIKQSDVFLSPIEKASDAELETQQKERLAEIEEAIFCRLDAGLEACPNTL